MEMLAGIKSPWEYRVKWYGETPEQAKAALPGMENMTDNIQDEVE